jgi:hypothetical protein
MKEHVVKTAVASWVIAFVTNCGGSSGAGAGAAGPSAAGGDSGTAAITVCATFYADGDLQGASLVAKGPSDDEPTIPASFNDVMSSVAVTPGCTVMAYADGNHGGQEVTFTQTAKTVPASINDQMSSFTCKCQ